jgi:hypothetical protein
MNNRRDDRMQWTEAEEAIGLAMDAIERLPAHASLTEAVTNLNYARHCVADYVDGVRMFHLRSEDYDAMIGASSAEEARAIFRENVDPQSPDAEVVVEELSATAIVEVAEGDRPDYESKQTADRWIAQRGRGVIGMREE